MNEDEILARQVLEGDSRAVGTNNKSGKNTGSGVAVRKSGKNTGEVYPSQTQMMHVPPQLPSNGQDAEIYSIVKGYSPDAVTEEKKTYYTPFPKVVFKVICIILIPVILIFAVAAYAKTRYFPTYGNFKIEVYNIDKPETKYYFRSRDTKRFPISATQTDIVTPSGVETTYWEGYYLNELKGATKFDDGFNYVIVVGEDESGNPRTVEYDHYTKLDWLMLVVFQISGEIRYNVYKGVLKTTKPANFIIMNPDDVDKTNWVYNAKEIRFANKS
ncbi:MAG: hypothetical protein LBT30_07790 [Clostridiales bacterium]|jgi:hypothetical protein|nr:hypothetical protein [Clostridiales bacterium]